MLRSVGGLVGRVRDVTRLRTFDTTTAAGRSRERWRRIVLTSASSVALRGVSLLSKLAIVPLALNYLGPERYGLLVTITALAGWFSLADLGVGSGLRTVVAEASGRDDHSKIRQYVASAYLVLSVVAVVIAAAFALLFPWIDWSEVFNVAATPSAAEAAPAVAVFVACVLIGIPLSVVSQAQQGYQEGFVTNAWNAAGSVTGLVGMLVATSLGAGMPVLVLVVAGSPVVALLLNTASVMWMRRWLRPHLRLVSRPVLKELGTSGTLFLGLQVGTAIVMFTDTIVVAQLFGPSAVTQYAVPWQLFSTLSVLLGLVLTPFWPAYAEAISRGDAEWVRRTVRRTFRISLGITVPAVVILVLATPMILRLWIGEQVAPSLLLLLGFGLAVVIISGIGGPISMLLNGANVLKLQAAWLAASAVANLLLSIYLARLFGPPGVIFGTVIAELAFGVLPYCYHLPRVVERVVPSTSTGGGELASGAR